MRETKKKLRILIMPYFKTHPEHGQRGPFFPRIPLADFGPFVSCRRTPAMGPSWMLARRRRAKDQTGRSRRCAEKADMRRHCVFSTGNLWWTSFRRGFMSTNKSWCSPYVIIILIVVILLLLIIIILILLLLLLLPLVLLVVFLRLLLLIIIIMSGLPCTAP